MELGDWLSIPGKKTILIILFRLLNRLAMSERVPLPRCASSAPGAGLTLCDAESAVSFVFPERFIASDRSAFAFAGANDGSRALACLKYTPADSKSPCPSFSSPTE